MSASSPSGRPTLPLAGRRVLDRTTDWAELASRLLADLGATVVKVEPAGGSPTRRHAPVRSGVSLSWELRNAGKESIEVDESGEEGRELLARLAGWAEIVITERPEDAAFFDTYPGLIVAIVTPFGLTGPQAGHVATDAVIAAAGGQAFKAGLPTREPLPPPSRFCDDIASTAIAFIVLAALRQHDLSGHGDVIDLSIQAATAQMSDWSIPNGIARQRAGIVGTERRQGSGPLYPVFRCRDGFVRLVVLSPRQWHAMRDWMGERAEFLRELDLDGFGDRFAIAEAVLNPLYEEHFSEWDMEDAAAEAQRRGIVCTPALAPRDVLANEHLAVRRTFRDMPVAGGREVRLHAGFFEIEGVRAGPARSAPALDADRAAVLARLDAAPPATTPSGPPPTTRPLEGLRVMDFGQGAVGVEVGKAFAELGADVIKIETRTYPDFIRVQTGGWNTPSFTSSSRSKRALGVNFKFEEGRRVLLELAARSDVAVENSAAGVMEAGGLGFAALHAANPGLMMFSSHLMGSTGPWADWRGYGPSTLAPSGVLNLWDYPDVERPTGCGTIFPDQFVGRLGAVAALAGILGREYAGHGGRHIELAQIEGAAGIVGDLLAAESLEPGSALPLGSGHESAAPWGMYQCAGDDQWVAITCRDDADWAGLVATTGRGDASLDEPTRKRQSERLDEMIGGWTATLDKHDVVARCQANGVPCGAVLTGIELATDAQLVARGFPIEIDQPEVGPMVLEGPAYLARHLPPPRITPSPRLGEHTVEIAGELGFDAAAIDSMIAAGALELPPT